MSNDIVVELPLDRLEWEVATHRQKGLILRECLRDAFTIAAEACRDRRRRPAALVGRPEIIPIEESTIILDPDADPASLVAVRQRFSTAQLSKATRRQIEKQREG